MLKTLAKRTFSSKVFENAEKALFDVKNGARVIFGGFGLPGVAENAIRQLYKMKVQGITYISNSTSVPEWGTGLLIGSGQITKVITSFVGGNPKAEKLYLSGKMAIEFVPQGTLAERIKSAQVGRPAFYTATGVGNIVEFGGFPCRLNEDGSPKEVTRPKERRNFNGKDYLLEEAFDADFAFVKAHVGDKYGNLRYRLTTRNFNPVAAGAAKVTIAEVDHIVDRIPPDKIHTHGALVNRIYQADYISRKVERLKIAYNDDFENNGDSNKPKTLSTRDKICKRIAKELESGMYVNLGIGIPSEIPPFLAKDVKLDFQIENGLIGGGPYPTIDNIDPDLVNAGKETITTAKGFAMTDSADSFGVMRGKHLHLTILGGMQVSETGDLANWYIPGKKATGMGGGMDLAASCPVIVAMEHTNKGQPRILPKCTYPLTAKKCVIKVVTELAVFDFTKEGLVLIEKVPEISLFHIFPEYTL